VTKTGDILDALGIFLDEDATNHKKKYEVMLETTEKIVYSYLGLEPIHVSELSRISGYSVPRTMELLLSMELKGAVKQIGNQYYAVVL
jgi:predicted Rossmann fold nucleotide-binding protein DprA/Smf involved in DNA uptake